MLCPQMADGRVRAALTMLSAQQYMMATFEGSSSSPMHACEGSPHGVRVPCQAPNAMQIATLEAEMRTLEEDLEGLAGLLRQSIFIDPESPPAEAVSELDSIQDPWLL